MTNLKDPVSVNGNTFKLEEAFRPYEDIFVTKHQEYVNNDAHTMIVTTDDYDGDIVEFIKNSASMKKFLEVNNIILDEITEKDVGFFLYKVADTAVSDLGKELERPVIIFREDIMQRRGIDVDKKMDAPEEMTIFEDNFKILEAVGRKEYIEKEWKNDSRKWAKKTYGEDIVFIEIEHLDTNNKFV